MKKRLGPALDSKTRETMAILAIQELKERVWRANVELFQEGLVKYSFGNVSGIDRKRRIVAIKPSGVQHSQLTPEKIVLLDMKGQVIEGNLRPSSDTATHLVLYNSFPEIGGVAHTHSPYATAWAQAEHEIPCLGTTHADYSPLAIPCTPMLSDEAILGAYEHETGMQIVRTVRSLPSSEISMVLVGGHGPFTWGDSPEQAAHYSVMLEQIAELAYFTLTLVPGKTALKQTLVNKHFYRKHGKSAYYGQAKESA